MPCFADTSGRPVLFRTEIEKGWIEGERKVGDEIGGENRGETVVGI